MTIKAEDIVFVYSGGSNNLDPSKSIGGLPSINTIDNINNSLFDDVTETDYTDYRCFYIFNNSSTDSLYNSYIYLNNSATTVSQCQLGVSRITDVQILSLSEIPVSGNITLRYENINTSNILWNSNPNVFSENIQNSLNSLDLLSGVKVESINQKNYNILFLENDNYRNHELLSVSNNNLSPSVDIAINKTSQGQPINSIASLLPTDSTIPYNVNFYSTSSQIKLYLGELRPNDGVPIWIRRENSGELQNNEINQFDFYIVGNLINDVNDAGDSFLSLAKSCFYYT